jgi:integrase
LPHIKVERSDILREEELNRLLEHAESDLIDGMKVVKWKLFEIKIPPDRLQALIALLWLFGKRITETLRLQKKDVWVEEGFLCARFRVLKKKSRKDYPLPKIVLKKVTVDNPYTHYVTDYLATLKEDDIWLFPGRKHKRMFTIHNKEYDKDYTYFDDDEGRMVKETAWRIMKGLSKEVWNHLFRTSLATEMAEHEATEEDLMNWFDWDKYETAHGYVKGGPRMTEKWSKRRW